jgi:alpha-L-arabinofuranosidase
MKINIKRKLALTTAVFILSLLLRSEACCQSEVPQTLLPDGKPYLSWSDITHYTRTYHVNQNHPGASDNNDGTEEHPFMTINRAAQIVKAGERVCIHGGTYRELVRPRFSGEGPDRMIAYEAAPGEQVIISGSRILKTDWKLSVDPNDQANITAKLSNSLKPGSGNIFSKQLWMTTLPETLFEDGYFAFRVPNASNEEIDLMEWALRWKGRIPYSLPRGMLFQEGRRFQQLSVYEDLVHLPGSFWVSPDGLTVHIHPFGEVNPNGLLFEAAIQPHIFQPENAGSGYIRVSGLIMKHCANGFLRTGVGALFTMGGHHWIIENNTVTGINSMGIEVGFQIYESGDKRYTRRTDPDLGYNIIRHNKISQCGTAGIRGLGVTNALVEDNCIVDCGWQDIEFIWEIAGIKLLLARGTLVRNNYIARIQGGCGIWLDWDNKNSRVTGNIIHDINTVQGAIFIEASQVTNMIDNNVMWNINGQGVRIADTDNTIIVHNLFAHVSDELVVAKVATTRSLGGRKLSSTGNRFVNNFIVDQGKSIQSDDPGNVADYNVYVSTKPGQTALKDKGEHSIAINGEITFDTDHKLLTWKSSSPLNTAPLVKNCESDFFGRERTADHNIPGPFIGLTGNVTLQLLHGL